MTTEEKLKSFKAAAKQNKRIGGARTSRDTPPAEAQQTLGFARLEALLGHDSGAGVGARLEALAGELEALASAAREAKPKAAAQRAKLAVSHTQALLQHLFGVRDHLYADMAEAEPASERGAKGKSKPKGAKLAAPQTPDGDLPAGDDVAGLVHLAQGDLVLLMEAGYLSLEMNKHREAEEVFTGAAALVPHSEVPHMALGHLFFALNRFAPALKAHQKALSLNPQSAAALAAIGETLFFMRRHEEAVACLEQALALEPEGPTGDFVRALKDAHELGIFA